MFLPDGSRVTNKKVGDSMARLNNIEKFIIPVGKEILFDCEDTPDRDMLEDLIIKYKEEIALLIGLEMLEMNVIDFDVYNTDGYWGHFTGKVRLLDKHYKL